MFSFCHHCGKSISQDQQEGQKMVCRWCGKEIGTVETPEPKVIDKTEEMIRQGGVARCSVCDQVVEVRTKGDVKSFVPHGRKGEPRKVCPNSGKRVPEAAPAKSALPNRPQTSKDLSKYMNRECIRVVACGKQGEPTIEELNLEYIDKNDRVRVQIDAVRDILNGAFRMSGYPARLNRPDLAVWSTATHCVIAKKHERGGYLPMSDSEIQQVLEDMKQRRQLFFA